MKIHVLAGDALVEGFNKSNIEGEVVVCRECLVDGDVDAENLEDFWKIRAEFIGAAYGETEEKYFGEVARELEKLKSLPPGSEVNLWFEYELFCQVNMWFCLALLLETGADVFRVMPIGGTEEDVWKGFGDLRPGDLKKCFAERIKFKDADLSLGAHLWRAFQNADYEKLEQLSETESDCFPRLKEVCRAEIEKSYRPKNILREIVRSGSTDFAETFSQFTRKAGVYGFGDAQVKRILQEI